MNIVPHAPLSAEWHAYRQPRVTGSTAAAILGESAYSSPLYEWSRILGRTTRQDEGNAYSSWGQASEAAHRLWLAQDGVGEVWTVDGIVQSEAHPWLCCTTDGFIGQEGADDFCVVELKAPSQWTADEWRVLVPGVGTTAKLPVRYLVQAEVNAACCGAGASYLSAILPPEKDPGAAFVRFGARMIEAGKDGIAYDDGAVLHALQASGFRRVGDFMPSNARFRAAVLASLGKFWRENVEQGIAPTATGLECDRHVLKGMGGQLLNTDFDEQSVALYDELQVVNAEIGRLEDRKATIQNQLVQAARASTWMEAKKAINHARKASA